MIEKYLRLRLDYKKCFEAMWSWLAKNPTNISGILNEKRNWPGFKTIRIICESSNIKLYIPHFNHLCRNHCFACQTVRVVRSKFQCFNCPVKHTNIKLYKSCKCENGNSYYDKWRHSKTPNYYPR